MALQELYQAYIRKSDFWEKIAGACMIAAAQIAEESPATPNHANRITWALQVRDDPKNKALEMLTDVIRDPTIYADVAGAADADIQTVVDGLVDTYATG